MKKWAWILPTKRKGESLQSFHRKLDPSLIEALRILAAEETDDEGILISQATIITTLLLEPNQAKSKRLRQIFKQLKREQNYEITTEKSNTDQTR